MDILSDHHHRRQAATSETSHELEGELAILGRIALRDLQAALKLLGDAERSLNVARRPPAEADDVYPERLQAEHGVERGHPEQLCGGDVQPAGRVLHRPLGEIAEGPLNVCEKGDRHPVAASVLARKRSQEALAGVRLGCRWRHCG